MPDLVPPPQPSPVVEQFECDLRFSGRAAAWIHLCGELDLASVRQFEQSLEHAFSSALMAVVDLRQLTFIDSTGLHALIKADAQARRSGRRLVVVRGPAQIDRLFDLVGVSDRLKLIDLGPVVVSPPVHPVPAPANVA